MASDSLLSALLGQSAQERLSNDPFYVSGVGLSRQQIAPRNNTEAFLIPALQGLAAGGMQGYGRANVASSMATSPLIDALKIDRSTLDTSDPFKVENVLSQALLGNQLEQAQVGQDNELRKSALSTLAQADPDAAVAQANSILAALNPTQRLADQTTIASPTESALNNDVEGAAMPKFLEVQARPTIATPERPMPFTGNSNSPKYKASKDVFEAERALANDFIKNPVVTDYRYKEQGARALAEAYLDTKGTSDFELLRRVTQMIEPGLAVRQDDQDSLQQAASIMGMSLQKVKAMAQGDTQLDPNVRAGMMRIAKRALDTSLNDYNSVIDNYTQRASGASIDPSRVVIYDKGKSFGDLFPDLKIEDLDIQKRLFAEQAKAAGMSAQQAREAWAAKGLE